MNAVKILVSILAIFNIQHTEGVDLTAFNLPPCCNSAYAAQSQILLPAASGKNLELDELTSSQTANQNQTFSQVTSFLFPMISDTDHEKDEPKNKTKRENTEKTDRTELNFDHTLNSTTQKQMPPEWTSLLKRVLYQSMTGEIKDAENGEQRDSSSIEGNPTAASKNNIQKIEKSDLWEEIYEAPIQVMDSISLSMSSNHEALIPLQSISSQERISGVLVSTSDGIKIRTQDQVSSDSSASESRSGCDCTLIRHGDTLLAYWSVGFSGNDLEYLVYPLPHNVPTPPILHSFHHNFNIRPSPIDLNPLIASRSELNEIPFQASLQYGVGTKLYNTISHNPSQKFNYQQQSIRYPTGAGYEYYHSIGLPPPQVPPPYHHAIEHIEEKYKNMLLEQELINKNIQTQDLAHQNIHHQILNQNLRDEILNQNFINQNLIIEKEKIKEFASRPQFPPLEPLYPPNVQQPIQYPPIIQKPIPPYLPNVQQQQPIPFKGDFRKKLDIQPPPPGYELQQGIGQLDPFNLNHPKSIQEILLHNPHPPGNDYPPPPIPPGPNSGIPPPLPLPKKKYGGVKGYPPGYHVPKPAIVKTRPPGIFVAENQYEKPQDYYEYRRPTNYNYRSSNTNFKVKDDCYAGNCGGVRSSSNANNKIKDRNGRNLKNQQHEESAYLLDF